MIKLISKYQWVVTATRTTMTGACTMLTDQRGPVDSTEATSTTCSIPTKSQECCVDPTTTMRESIALR